MMRAERPQNKNLKPFGSGKLTAEEEQRIHVKGAMATNRIRKRNADMRSAAQSILNFSFKGRGRSIDVEKMVSVEDLEANGAPLIARLVYAQVLRAIEGDKEARDWICNMLLEDATCQQETSAGITVEDGMGSVRIHLIRKEPEQLEILDSEAATQEEDRA